MRGVSTRPRPIATWISSCSSRASRGRSGARARRTTLRQMRSWTSWLALAVWPDSRAKRSRGGPGRPGEWPSASGSGLVAASRRPGPAGCAPNSVSGRWTHWSRTGRAPPSCASWTGWPTGATRRGPRPWQPIWSQLREPRQTHRPPCGATLRSGSFASRRTTGRRSSSSSSFRRRSGCCAWTRHRHPRWASSSSGWIP